MSEALSFKEFYLTEQEELDESSFYIWKDVKKARDAKRRKNSIKIST